MEEDNAVGSPPRDGSTDLLERRPPPEVFRRHLELRRRLSVLLLSLLSAMLLGVSFAPYDCWPLAYIALVPWAMAMGGGLGRKWAILCSGLGGALFWFGSVYWLSLPTVLGYVAASIYLSLYWVVAGWVVGSAMRRNWPMWLVLPVVWIALEYARSNFISFPWFLLGHTQYRRTMLIQVADLFGAYGVSFFVAMVNGVVVELLAAPLFVRRQGGGGRLTRRIPHAIFLAVLVWVAMLVYGEYRLHADVASPHMGSIVPEPPTIGVVQESIPITLSGREYSQRQILEMHIDSSLQFLGGDCDLVVWPETMLSMGLNHELLSVDPSTIDRDDLRALVSRMAMKDLPELDGYTDARLREYVRDTLGAGKTEAYLPAAARFVAWRFLKAAELARLDEKILRRLGVLLIGPAAAELDGRLLRAGVGLFLDDAPPPGLKTAEQRRLAEAMLGQGPAGAIQEDSNLLPAIRGRVRNFRTDDEKLSDLLRFQACLVQVCAILVDCPILAGGTSLKHNPRAQDLADRWGYYNSAVWIDPAGTDPGGLSPREYAKIDLVPFSEYVPFKYSAPSIHRMLRWFVPKVMFQLEPGTEPTRFTLRRGEETWKIVTPICYEGTLPGLCRETVRAGPKDRLIMMNLSNDGWFVYRTGPGSPGGARRSRPSTWSATSFARWRIACPSSAA